MSRLGPHSIRRLGLLAAAAVSILVGLLAWQGSVLGRLEGESIDARFAIRGSAVPSDVAVVAIDEKTFSDLHQQWPFHRALHAQMIDRLHREGVAQIIYDVQFTEPTDPTDDLALFHAAGRAGHLVFATTEVDAEGHTDVLGGESNLGADRSSRGSGEPTGRIGRSDPPLSEERTRPAGHGGRGRATRAPQRPA